MAICGKIQRFAERTALVEIARGEVLVHLAAVVTCSAVITRLPTEFVRFAADSARRVRAFALHIDWLEGRELFVSTRGCSIRESNVTSNRIVLDIYT